jgi:hypothetical protein
MAAFAAQVTPPSDSSASTGQEVSVNPGVLADYVGFYKFTPYTVMTVKLDGSQLVAQLTGQGPLPIFPTSPTEFFCKARQCKNQFCPRHTGECHRSSATSEWSRYDCSAYQCDGGAGNANRARRKGKQPTTVPRQRSGFADRTQPESRLASAESVACQGAPGSKGEIGRVSCPARSRHLTSVCWSECTRMG